MILFIAVNYHSADVVPRLVTSLLEQTDRAWNLLIVDNGDTPRGRVLLDDLGCRDARVSVIRPGTNLGYFGAARHGLDHRGLGRWSAAEPWPKWVIVGNVDVRLASREFLALLRLADTEIAAPSIVSPASGKDENPHLTVRPTYAEVARGAWVSQSYLVGQAARLYQDFVRARLQRQRTVDMSSARRIYAPHGSLICFNESYFRTGGSLDHGVFLFGEEISVAEQALAIGARVIYTPRLRAEHLGHVSTGTLQSREVAAHARAASRYVLDVIGRQSRSPQYGAPNSRVD